MNKKIMYLLWCILTAILCIGCAGAETAVEKVKDLDFTVLGQEEQPESLIKILEEKKVEPFEMTYVEGDYLYICVGYGMQNSGGYSIQVEDFYLGENCIYVNTTLLGPSQEESTGDDASYPYIILKTEYLDKTVVFE